MSNNTQPPWDHAPPDAEFAGIHPTDGEWRFYKHVTAHSCYFTEPGNARWLDKSEPPKARQLILRPKPEQEWDGVPPVGWHGEVIWGTKTDWRECVILPGYRVAWDDFGRGWSIGNIWDNAEFRPLPSPRDRAIDAAVKEYAESNLPDYFVTAAGTIKQIAGLWYDAGLLREVE